MTNSVISKNSKTAFERDLLAIPDKQIEQAKARLRLLDFARYVVPNYQDTTHLRILCDALQDVAEGRCRRLMVFMPPRHGKSLIVSNVFPCWVLGNRPETVFILTGYALDIARSQSIKAKQIFASEAMREVFPKVGTDRVLRSASNEWGTFRDDGTMRVSVIAAGVNGPITGKGAVHEAENLNGPTLPNLFAITDDPHKDRAEAESTVRQAAAFDWHESTLSPRITPFGAEINVMQRWSLDDLAGMLLRAEEDEDNEDIEPEDKWRVISMPAINDKGEALWPEAWPVKRLLRKKKKNSISQHAWASQYQQQPTIRGGNMFVMSGVKIHRNLDEFPGGSKGPAMCRRIWMWDPASSTEERQGDDPDFTWGTLLGYTVDADGQPHLWIWDCEYMKAHAPRRNRVIIETATAAGPEVIVGIEAVAGYLDTFFTLQDKLKGKNKVALKKKKKHEDKVAVCACLEALFEAHSISDVYSVHLAPGKWHPEWMKQFSQFPNGKHDDAPDSCAMGYTWLLQNKPMRAR